jgi:hypothetical protein
MLPKNLHFFGGGGAGNGPLPPPPKLIFGPSKSSPKCQYFAQPGQKNAFCCPPPPQKNIVGLSKSSPKAKKLPDLVTLSFVFIFSWVTLIERLTACLRCLERCCCNNSNSRYRRYKTFYDRKLRRYVISWSVFTCSTKLMFSNKGSAYPGVAFFRLATLGRLLGLCSRHFFFIT